MSGELLDDPAARARLTAWLAGHVDGFGGPLTVEKFAGGQSNPTYRLTTPARRYVLRRQPTGPLLPSAHAVDREYRVLAALADTAVPVPRVHQLCRDSDVLGTMFYVMEHLDGRVFWDPALPELAPAARGRVYAEMIRVLAAIHDVDLARADLLDYGRAGNYFERQVARWSRQYETSRHPPAAAMQALMAWLPAHLPPDDGQVSLVHGDYRLDNLMFATDRLAIIGVFDWELSTLGHPFADLGFHALQRYMGADWPIRGLAGLDTALLGIPSERELVAAYCSHRGLAGIDHWPFYLAFAAFRLAAICDGIGERLAQGNASSTGAAAVAALATPLSELGWRLARGERS